MFGFRTLRGLAASLHARGKGGSATPARRYSRTPLQMERLEDRQLLTTVAYWRFEEGIPDEPAGGINMILDSSGYELHGTPFNGPVYRADVGQDPIPLTQEPNTLSLGFNGANQRVFVPDDRLFRLTDKLTLEVYINVRGLVPSGQIVFRGDDRIGLDPYYLRLAGKQIQFGINDELNRETRVTAILPSLDTWLHVAGTLNGETGEMALYLDGKLVDYAVTTLRPFALLDPTRNPGLGIGSTQSPNSPQHFNGRLDEVRISDEALTPEQFLNAHSCGGFPSPGPSPEFGLDVGVLAQRVSRPRVELIPLQQLAGQLLRAEEHCVAPAEFISDPLTASVTSDEKTNRSATPEVTDILTCAFDWGEVEPLEH